MFTENTIQWLHTHGFIWLLNLEHRKNNKLRDWNPWAIPELRFSNLWDENVQYSHENGELIRDNGYFFEIYSISYATPMYDLMRFSD